MHLEPTEAWWLLGVCVTLVVIFLLVAHFTKLKTKIPRFYSWIGAIAIFGGVLAFLLPIALNSGFGKDDDGRVLRQLILYTTGGVLGVITLGETHRKNNQEKEKNENDHIREVHAERRSRYTKAVEQLADANSAIRLGGVYTLVGLADEWLTDKDLKSKKQQKEGQVIINNLCAYIRSPYEFATGQDTVREREVRKTIFNEISIRTKEDSQKDKTNWSDLLFEFQGAVFFYELDLQNMEFKKNVDFSGAKFFYSAKFKNINFKGGVKFTSTKFSTHENHLTSFSDCSFQNSNSFERAEFNGEVQFSDTHFNSVRFGESRFFQKASFSNFTSNETPSFTDALFTIYEPHYFGFNYTSPDAIIPSGDSPLVFSVYPIEFKNNSQEIPKYSRLFDPKSKNQETGDYDKSERAQ
jgi:hypothetical protein